MLTQLTQQLLGAVHETPPPDDHMEQVAWLQDTNNQLNKFIDQSHAAYSRTIAELEAKLSAARMYPGENVEHGGGAMFVKERLVKQQQYANSSPSLMTTTTTTTTNKSNNDDSNDNNSNSQHKRKKEKRRRSSSFKFWKRRSSVVAACDESGGSKLKSSSTPAISKPISAPVPIPLTNDIRSIADPTLVSKLEQKQSLVEEMTEKMIVMENRETFFRTSMAAKETEIAKLRQRIAELKPEVAELRHSESQSFQLLKFAEDYFRARVVEVEKVGRQYFELFALLICYFSECMDIFRNF